ncbi:MAG: Rpn family recombination-promoting nuclease/putative transposase [Planctomycetes bacterium]|nr:Rpn family recombination-promoting nuclease/putative transposase [Planctomycetota bacterium]
MHDHDALFRSTFTDPQHAASLLRVLLPPALVRAADWPTLTLLPGTFVDAGLRDRESDLLFSLVVAGRPVLVYVLLEHKSFVDRWVAFQLLQYVVRIHEAFRRAHPEATHLPPVVPVVVHHGPRGWSAARTVLDLIDLDGLPPPVQQALAPLQPNQHFLLDDLAAMPEGRIRHRGTTAQATLVLLALQFVRQAPDADPVGIVERWLPLWRAVQRDPSGRFGLLVLLSYLARQLETDRERFVQATIRIEEHETMGKTLWEKAVEEGRQKGKAEGKAAGRAELLLRLLHRRFGELPADLEERVRSADVAALDTWAERVLDAQSLDEMFR